MPTFIAPDSDGALAERGRASPKRGTPNGALQPIPATWPGASVRARSASVAALPVDAVKTLALNPQAQPRHRRSQRGTLVASVRPGHEVLLRSATHGPVVARIGTRTEFG